MLRFHHQMVCVKDMEEAIHLFQDVLGFELVARMVVPDDRFMPEELVKENFGQTHKWEIALFDSNAGALIELTHAIDPPVQLADPEWVNYFYTGITELGFMVDGLDAWYKKIVDAGYKTQSEPWPGGISGRTFVFFDKEGNIIQLWEDTTKPDIPHWDRFFDTPDVRTPEQIELLKKTYR